MGVGKRGCLTAGGGSPRGTHRHNGGERRDGLAQHVQLVRHRAQLALQLSSCGFDIEACWQGAEYESFGTKHGLLSTGLCEKYIPRKNENPGLHADRGHVPPPAAPPPRHAPPPTTLSRIRSVRAQKRSSNTPAWRSLSLPGHDAWIWRSPVVRSRSDGCPQRRCCGDEQHHLSRHGGVRAGAQKPFRDGEAERKERREG